MSNDSSIAIFLYSYTRLPTLERSRRILPTYSYILCMDGIVLERIFMDFKLIC